MTPDLMELIYRGWFFDSYGIPPNKQAVATAVAWGQHLQDLLRTQENSTKDQ